MNPILILLVAMAIVIGGVVVARVHAFFALLAGALTVAFLSSSVLVRDTEMRRQAARIVNVASEGQVELKIAKGQKLSDSEDVFVLRSKDTMGPLKSVASASLQTVHGRSTLQNLQPVEDGADQDQEYKVEIADMILTVEQFHRADQITSQIAPLRVVDGFWQTLKKIGILIALAAIVGMCLLESGAAERIVIAIRARLGEERTPVAFTLSGFVVGIPVFFDTVFYLLLPLAKAMRRRTGKDYLLYVMSIVVGATMAHSLVPPTPGPLFVAVELGVGLNKMILAGSIVGLLAAASGYVYVLFANRMMEIPLRESANESPVVGTDDANLPPLVLSLLPIVVPVTLLAAKNIWGKSLLASEFVFKQRTGEVVNFLGEPNMAIAAAAIIGLAMFLWRVRESGRRMQAIRAALESAANIVLITSIGGAFGFVLRQSGIAQAIQNEFPATTTGLMLLVVAFGITAVVRVAQGSATVAMITAIGIVAPLASSIELSFDPVYLALAIGCGSKPLPWMNDSGFWIVSRMSGMTERETLLTQTVTLTIMGVAGFLVTLAGATWIPMR